MNVTLCALHYARYVMYVLLCMLRYVRNVMCVTLCALRYVRYVICVMLSALRYLRYVMYVTLYFSNIMRHFYLKQTSHVTPCTSPLLMRNCVITTTLWQRTSTSLRLRNLLMSASKCNCDISVEFEYHSAGTFFIRMVLHNVTIFNAEDDSLYNSIDGTRIKNDWPWPKTRVNAGDFHPGLQVRVRISRHLGLLNTAIVKKTAFCIPHVLLASLKPVRSVLTRPWQNVAPRS